MGQVRRLGARSAARTATVVRGRPIAPEIGEAVDCFAGFYIGNIGGDGLHDPRQFMARDARSRSAPSCVV